MFDVWPVCALNPGDVGSSFSGGAATVGGRTASGSIRVAQWSAGGLVRIVYENITIRTRSQILAAQAIEGILDGGATPIIVPMLPLARAPDTRRLSTLVPHSDETPFSDGSLYMVSGSEAVIEEAAEMGDTTITLSRLAALDPLIGGEIFSVMNDGVPQGHKIIRILDIAEAGSGDTARLVYTVNIRVPLRADLAAGSEVAMRNPACLMRMENAVELGVLLQKRRWGQFTARFVEATAG